MIRAGNEVRIKVSGAPLSFTDEATTSVDNRIYAIANKSKEIWDMNVPVIVKNGASVTSEPFIIDYVRGTIIFDKVDALRNIKVSGSYVTTSTVGKAYKYSLSEKYNIYDITCFDDVVKKRMTGEGEASGEISDFDVLDTYYRDALLQGKEILIEISSFEGDPNPTRLWAILESRELASAFGSPQEATVSFLSTGRF